MLLPGRLLTLPMIIFDDPKNTSCWAANYLQKTKIANLVLLVTDLRKDFIVLSATFYLRVTEEPLNLGFPSQRWTSTKLPSLLPMLAKFLRTLPWWCFSSSAENVFQDKKVISLPYSLQPESLSLGDSMEPQPLWKQSEKREKITTHMPALSVSLCEQPHAYC